MGMENLKNQLSGAVEGVSAHLKDEQKTDELLDKAANLANEKTGGKHADHVNTARDFLDSKLGDEQK